MKLTAITTVSIRELEAREDIYCLTVPGYGNYAIDDAGTCSSIIAECRRALMCGRGNHF